MLVKKITTALVSAALLAGMLLAGCSNEPYKDDEQPAKPPAVEESQKPAEPPAGGPSLPLIKPYPKGDIGPWLPPLPPGLDQPGSWNEDEWEKVIELARTEPEVQRQIKKDNIRDMVYYWVGYAGGSGHLSRSIPELESKGFEEGLWYYPAIKFVYRSRTDRNGQIVAVDSIRRGLFFQDRTGVTYQASYHNIKIQ